MSDNSLDIVLINFLLFSFLNRISDSALCQHAKKVCSSCGSNSGGSSSSIGSGGSGSNNVIKQNGASKESKELKSKKPNWGIKLNCTKLKGIKSLSSSLSSERKYHSLEFMLFSCALMDSCHVLFLFKYHLK